MNKLCYFCQKNLGVSNFCVICSASHYYDRFLSEGKIVEIFVYPADNCRIHLNFLKSYVDIFFDERQIYFSNNIEKFLNLSLLKEELKNIMLFI